MEEKIFSARAVRELYRPRRIESDIRIFGEQPCTMYSVYQR